MLKNAGWREAVRGVFRSQIRPVAYSLLVLAFPVSAFSVQPTTQQMVGLSIASSEADWKATPNFSYAERDTDGGGGTTTSKTYRVWTIEGSPYYRLIAIGDEPLSPAQEARETEKLQKEIAKRARESSRERAKRLAQYEEDRGRMFALLHEMAEAFDFKLVGEQRLDDRNVYVLQASPLPGYQPTSRETKILTGMRGTLWIGKDTYKWVKVEAEVTRPVWIGWFIAKVLPGTNFLLEQTPVMQSLWLPKHFSIEAKARVLWFQKYYSHSETYQDYRLPCPPSNPESRTFAVPRPDCAEARITVLGASPTRYATLSRQRRRGRWP
jgi:hypothetical protein